MPYDTDNNLLARILFPLTAIDEETGQRISGVYKRLVEEASRQGFDSRQVGTYIIALLTNRDLALHPDENRAEGNPLANKALWFPTGFLARMAVASEPEPEPEPIDEEEAAKERQRKLARLAAMGGEDY